MNEYIVSKGVLQTRHSDTWEGTGGKGCGSHNTHNLRCTRPRGPLLPHPDSLRPVRLTASRPLPTRFPRLSRSIVSRVVYGTGRRSLVLFVLTTRVLSGSGADDRPSFPCRTTDRRRRGREVTLYRVYSFSTVCRSVRTPPSPVAKYVLT